MTWSKGRTYMLKRSTSLLFLHMEKAASYHLGRWPNAGTVTVKQKERKDGVGLRYCLLRVCFDGTE